MARHSYFVRIGGGAVVTGEAFVFSTNRGQSHKSCDWGMRPPLDGHKMWISWELWTIGLSLTETRKPVSRLYI
jgi:hypothetical protein